MKRTAWLIILLMVLFSCSKKPSASKQEGEVYFPQGSDGSQREYLVKISTPGGNQEGKLSIRTEGKEVIQGKTYQKEISLIMGQPGAKPQTSYVRRDSKGIYRIDPKNKNTEYLLIPFPMKVGQTWTVERPDGRTASTAEKIENIEFLGKVYKDCLKITVQGSNNSKPFEGYSYYAPGVGEVATQMNIGNASIMYVLNKHSS